MDNPSATPDTATASLTPVPAPNQSSPYVWQDANPSAAPAGSETPVKPEAQTAPAESSRAALIRRAATVGVAGAGLVAAAVATRKVLGVKTTEYGG